MIRTQRKPRPAGRLQSLRTAPFYLLSGILIYGIWMAGVLLTAGTARHFLLPTPGEVWQRFGELWRSGVLLDHTGTTLLEMGAGFAVGAAVALLLGYTVAHVRLAAYLFEPVIVVSQAVPIVALAPLLTVWFGPGLASKIVVCALIVFFPILVNVTAGLNAIDPRLRDVFRMLEASRLKVITALEIPGALPSVLSGIKVGGTLAGMGAVVGEFVASTRGLGYLVKQGQNLYDLPMMFVAILTLVVIALAIYSAMTWLEHRLLRWRKTDRSAYTPA